MAESRIKYLSWIEFNKKRQETSLVVIPSGAIEVYGPHMPLGTDIIVAEKISQLIAERIPAVVGPSIEVGDSRGLSAFPGTLVISPENLKAVYKDISLSFIKWGFKSIFFVNTHLGNVAPLNQLGEELQASFDVKCAAVDWPRFLQGLSEGIVEGKWPHSHASDTGASVLLYLAPEYVRMDLATKMDPQYQDKYPDIFKYVPFSAYTSNGMIGDATKASREKGKVIVEKAVNRLVDFIKNVLL
jgi:creatinine amidohydrolase